MSRYADLTHDEEGYVKAWREYEETKKPADETATYRLGELLKMNSSLFTVSELKFLMNVKMKRINWPSVEIWDDSDCEKITELYYDAKSKLLHQP